MRFAPGAEGSFGDVNVPEEAFRPENERWHISIKIPGDVLDAIKALAKQEGLPYQTLINRILRDAVMGEGSLSSRVAHLEKLAGVKR